MSQICSKCGAVLSDDAVFCENCGAVQRQNSFREKRCVKCGQLLDGDERFCGSCGEPVSWDDGSWNGQAGSSQQNQADSRWHRSGVNPADGQWQQPVYRDSQGNDYRNRSDNTKVIALAAGCTAVIIIAVAVLFLFKDSLFGKKNDSVQEPPIRIEETDRENAAASEDAESSAEDTDEEIEADIDGVHSRNCFVSGTIYYTENMDTPVVILDTPLSVYANSTSGEKVFYKSVSNIFFGGYAFSDDEIMRYNDVQVDVSGSIWAEDEKVFIDVNQIYGEPKEPETEARTDGDYIIADSDSRLLTNSDVAGLSLKEINYAKNEIYARHGRKFDSRELREYFNSKDWYNGRIDPEDFTDRVFNSYEKKNVQFLAKKEESVQKGGYKLDQ